MPTTYTITFVNEHGSDGEYVFCMGKPIVNSDPTAKNVITNAWISKYVPNGADLTLTTESQFYAWCGKSPSQSADGIASPQGHGEAVELGTNKNGGDTLTMILEDGAATFDKTKAKTAPIGCCSIAQPTGFRPRSGTGF